MTIGPGRALTHIDVDDPVFPDIQIIDVKDRGHPNCPIPWPEGRGSMKDLKACDEVLVEKQLTAATKKLTAGTWDHPADSLRRRQISGLKEGIGHAGKAEEGSLSEDRIIALNNIEIVWIPPTSSIVDSPAIPDRNEVAPLVLGQLFFGWPGPATRESLRRLRSAGSWRIWIVISRYSRLGRTLASITYCQTSADRRHSESHERDHDQNGSTSNILAQLMISEGLPQTRVSDARIPEASTAINSEVMFSSSH